MLCASFVHWFLAGAYNDYPQKNNTQRTSQHETLGACLQAQPSVGVIGLLSDGLSSPPARHQAQRTGYLCGGWAFVFRRDTNVSLVRMEKQWSSRIQSAAGHILLWPYYPGPLSMSAHQWWHKSKFTASFTAPAGPNDVALLWFGNDVGFNCVAVDARTLSKRY